MKVYPFIMFLNLSNLNIQAQEDTKDYQFYSLRDHFSVITHPKHTNPCIHVNIVSYILNERKQLRNKMLVNQ